MKTMRSRAKEDSYSGELTNKFKSINDSYTQFELDCTVYLLHLLSYVLISKTISKLYDSASTEIVKEPCMRRMQRHICQ